MISRGRGACRRSRSRTSTSSGCAPGRAARSDRHARTRPAAPQHLERARQQPALVAMRDLGAPLRLERLAVGAPERCPLTLHTAGSNRNVCVMRVIMARDRRFAVRCGKRQHGGCVMLTERIWSGNSLRNFHYLVACAETGEALAVDPLEWRLCLDAARRRGWQITADPEHPRARRPHRRQRGLKAATGAQVLAHAGAAARIGGVDRGLAAGDVIRVGRTRRARVPRHARTHHDARVPAVACGASRRSTAATRSSMRAPATATTAATRTRSTTPSSRSWRGCPKRRASTRGTNISHATSSSPSTASPTTAPPRRSCRAPAATIRPQRS